MRTNAATLLLLPLLLGWVVGCGGSSSETPPPLEPDPTLGRYAGPRMPSKEDDAPPPPAAEPDEDDLPPKVVTPARTTWGSGASAPRSGAQKDPSKVSPAKP
jgi:hypothetical protein